MHLAADVERGQRGVRSAARGNRQAQRVRHLVEQDLQQRIGRGRSNPVEPVEHQGPVLAAAVDPVEQQASTTGA